MIPLMIGFVTGVMVTICVISILVVWWEDRGDKHG